MVVDIKIWRYGKKIIDEYKDNSNKPRFTINSAFAKQIVNALNPFSDFNESEAVEMLLKELKKTEEPMTKAFISILETDDYKQLAEFVKTNKISKENILLSAVSYNCKNIIGLMIKNSVKINYVDNIGWTALMTAILYDYLPVAEYLIKKGGEVNYVNKFGTSAMALAVVANNKPMVELLLANKARTDVTIGKDKTVIEVAKESGFTEIAELLESKAV